MSGLLISGLILFMNIKKDGIQKLHKGKEINRLFSELYVALERQNLKHFNNEWKSL